MQNVSKRLENKVKILARFIYYSYICRENLTQ